MIVFPHPNCSTTCNILNQHLEVINTRDGNSSLRLGLESHLSRINKDLGLDLDS